MIASPFIKLPTGHERNEVMLSETRGLVMNILLGGYIYIYTVFNPCLLVSYLILRTVKVSECQLFKKKVLTKRKAKYISISLTLKFLKSTEISSHRKVTFGEPHVIISSDLPPHSVPSSPHAPLSTNCPILV